VSVMPVQFSKDEVAGTLTARFEKIVAEYPARVAVTNSHHVLTYTELNNAVNRVARAILNQLGPGSEPVALSLEQSVAAVVAILGVLKASKIYVPLDPSFPQPRINYMLEDSQANLVVTNTKNLDLANSFRAPRPDSPGQLVINVDAIEPTLSSENIAAALSPDTPAVLLYTSGSTGQPKGIVHSHRSILHEAWMYHQAHQLGPADRLGLLFSYSFAASLGEIFGALMNGATQANDPSTSETVEKRLVAYLVPSSQSAPSVSALREALAERLPDYMVPSAFVMLENLPLTPTGKIDRRALPAPETSRPELPQDFIAPRDTLELQLTQIWEEILGIQPIGVTDNFFDLGGHSLQAMHLFAQIGQKLNKKIPVTTLFQAPTIEHLAEILRQEGWLSRWSSLVPIQPLQPHESRLPFFCVPPGASTVLIFADLARHLGPEQPLYGLQPLGMDGRHPPHSRVEDMAAHYLSEIRALQPEGPYFLGGMCFGGIVAFEMAQQLHQQGQEVALLAILDTQYPPFQKSFRNYVRLLVYHWRRRQLLPILRAELGRVVLGDKIRIKTWVPDDPLAKRLQQVYEAHNRARRAYNAQVYPGRITLFWAGDTRLFGERRSDWSLLTEQLEERVVPGAHKRQHNISFIREPHVRSLAQELKVCLEQAWPVPAREPRLNHQDLRL